MNSEEYGFYTEWDAQKRPPLPPTTPTTNGTTPGTAYAQAALEAELAVLQAAPEGERNHQLNKSGYSLYQLVAAGALQETTVDEALVHTARAIGLTDSETVRTIRSSKAGLNHPRTIPASVDHAPPVTTLNADDPDTKTELELWRARKTAEETERQRAQRAARKILDNEETTTAFREPPHRENLTAELQIPDEPIPYTVDQLLPTGGNVLLTAQYKAGKTTLIDNLAKALADRTPFLDKFDTDPTTGRIAIFNYENDERLYRRWLRDTTITDTDRVTILNLRGYRLPITTPHIENWVTDWLTTHHIDTWIVDPFARAYTGSGRSENDNTEVGAFLDTLDVIKNRAGVANLILVTHTGRENFNEGDERARGATRLDDWADVRWILTQDDAGCRYLSATGRDVDVAEEKLDYHQATRTLTFGGGNRSWEKRIRLEDTVTQIAYDSPGIIMRDIRDAVAAAGIKARAETIGAAVAGAVKGHRIRVEKVGGSVGNKHYSTQIRAIGESNT